MTQVISNSKRQSFSLTNSSLTQVPWSKLLRFLTPLSLALFLWSSQAPEGVSEQAWHLLTIFLSTIVAIILQPLPMGAVAFLGLVSLPLSGTLTLEEALSGFAQPSIWLILCAFFVARGFIKTGLGRRIAFLFLKGFGKSSVGMGYGLILSDLLMAPAIPSSTARSGGVLLPVVQSLSDTLGSRPHDRSSKRIGEFLTLIAFHGAVITNCMFVTSMAANPLVLSMALDSGISMTWTSWALGGLVPGLFCLGILPVVLTKLVQPELRTIEKGPTFATEKLREMGPMTGQEYLMLGTFVVLVALWVGGSSLGIHPTLAAMIGLSLLVLSGVLTWKDVTQEETAWDTLMWFATLVMMAGFLNKMGIIQWFSQNLAQQVGGTAWPLTLLLLCGLYFYSHYLFASNTAHASATFAPFLALSLASGTPPMLAAAALSYVNSLCGGLTHYGCGHAPVLFGKGYVPLTTWWRVGAILGTLNLLIWAVIGGLWWKILGWW